MLVDGCCLVADLCLTPLQPHELQMPGSFLSEIFQARMLEWVLLFPPPKDPPNLGLELMPPPLAGGYFPAGPPGKRRVNGVDTQYC